MNNGFDMELFLGALESGYQQSEQHPSTDSKAVHELNKRLNSLKLTAAQGRKLSANFHDKHHIIQIAVIGPTQAGKSTLVNAITHSNLAGVSALAGYTVHAHGIVNNVDVENADTEHAINKVFVDFERVSADRLQQEQLDQYALSTAPESKALAGKKSIIWDSPDFDSISASNYSDAVIRVAALADLVIYVLSKDKYADRSVWTMVDLLRPLEKPSTFVINKLDDKDRETVLGALKQRLTEEFGERHPQIVDIPYAGRDANPDNLVPASALDSLTHFITENSAKEMRHQQRIGTQQLVNKHWNSWIEPVRTEHEAHRQWEVAIDSLTDDAIDDYRTHYLDHPQKYDTFNRAVAELLTLLELPGLAKPLSSVRKFVTWPARQILDVAGLGNNQSDPSNKSPTEIEKQTLLNSASLLLSRAQNTAIDNSVNDETFFWATLSRQLRNTQPSLEQSIETEIDTYQKEFEPEIEAAARALYRQLQKQPAVLASLRAARVTTDAAAVILAVKSGGLAATDLLIAPAVLSVTSMLTEGAIGKYMDTVKGQMKASQQKHVSELFKRRLADSLKAIPDNLPSDNLFAINKSWLLQAEERRESIALQFEQSIVDKND